MQFIDLNSDNLPLEIMAVMHFPDDSKLREQYVEYQVATSVIQRSNSSDTCELGIKTIKILLDSQSKSEMEKLLTVALHKGMVAGDILASIYLMDKFKLTDEPSYRKAIQFIQNLAMENKFSDGTPVPTSDPAIRRIFETFKPCSHLWAAFRINESYRYCGDVFKTKENIIKFLGVASGILSFASNFTAKRSRIKDTLLKIDECYEIPSKIEKVVINTENAPLPDELINKIKDYKVQN